MILGHGCCSWQGPLFLPQFPNYKVLRIIFFFKKTCVSVLQMVFSFIEIQCGIAAKAEMIIQRVVLNSRPGMYFSPAMEQCVCYGCLMQNGKGRNTNLRY